jgi:Peptidase family M23
MTAQLRHVAASTLGGIALLLAGAGAAAAAGDYTLPFYNPSTELSYGMDRDPRWDVQLDWTGTLWLDGDPHYGRVYDNHTGLDYPMPLFTTVAASRAGTVVMVEGGYGTEEFGQFGNFVLLQHDDGRKTIYYHLAARRDGGILVDVGEEVLHGEPVGLSGCSGICYGPHLHFELLRIRNGIEEPIDPMALRLWTTWPGRVPFLAEYFDESNAGTEIIQRGRDVTHWVKFRNAGGRTWHRSGDGRIVLGTWDPVGRSSAFEDTDWISDSIPTALDQAPIAPDAIGRFTFDLFARPPLGDYDEAFNLHAQGVRWFNHAELGGFHVPIKVVVRRP